MRWYGRDGRKDGIFREYGMNMPMGEGNVNVLSVETHLNQREEIKNIVLENAILKKIND